MSTNTNKIIYTFVVSELAVPLTGFAYADLTVSNCDDPLFQHPGTEFIDVLEGSRDYSHSRSVYRLGPGDSLQLDGEGRHGPVALVDLPIRFLSVVAVPEVAL